MSFKVTRIVAPETSAGIKHPLQFFLANRLSEKFLHAIAAMGEMKRLELFFVYGLEFAHATFLPASSR